MHMKGNKFSNKIITKEFASVQKRVSNKMESFKADASTTKTSCVSAPK